MVRRVGFRAFGALLTLACVGIPAANAQAFFDAQLNGDFVTWSETRKARALDAINRADLSKEEIASILPLLRDLEMSERIRRADLARLENDLLFASKGDINVESRIAEINAAHRDRINKIWMTITDRIGVTKATTLRSLVDDSVIVDQTAYYRSDFIARTDSIFAEWDRLIVAREERSRQERLAYEERIRSQPPVVTVVPIPEQPVITETTVQAQTVQTQVRPTPPARFHRSPAPVKRAKRVKGLG